MRKYLAIILMMLPVISFAAGADLTNIRVMKTNTGTRIDFLLTHPAEQQIFMLSNPSRIVIDFDHTRLVEHLKNISLPTAEIKTVRSGYPKPHTLRLVFETNMPVSYQSQSSGQKQQYRLEIKAMKAGNTVTPKSVVTPKITTTAHLHRYVTIVIDAGHGGKDPGAIGVHGIKEKDVVLAIATRLAQRINAEPNMHAELTRDSDYFVPLMGRLKQARKGKADLFISIHADSYFNNEASGASIYTLSRRGASTVAAKWLAQRENYSELGGVDLGELKDQSHLLRSVLIDLAQTATTTDSLRLGTTLLDSLDDVTRLHYTRVEQAPFMVLKSPDIPSILVETGFMSNAKEELRLHDKKYQDALAAALFNGITRYLKKYPITG